MKFIIPILILINVHGLAQDTLPNFVYQHLIEKEINCCRGEKDQLKCVDSLIQINLSSATNSEKSNAQKSDLDRLRKLSIYHFTAASMIGLRGNLEESFIYFERTQRFLDTLSQNGKADEAENLKALIVYQKTELCAKTYLKDTVVFNRCNCMQFFPEIRDESQTTDTSTVPLTKYPNWGAFYIHDTLRFDPHFVSDSVSIVYFSRVLQPLIQSKLLNHPAYYEMLGDPALSLVRDTVIYRLSCKYENGKYERNCEVVFTSSQYLERFDYISLLIGNMEYPGLIKDLNIYIPLVFTTENTINNSAYVYDDHFRIEIEKIKPITLDTDN